ncbi:hypothetical protein SC09_Contig19orf01413 [Bacillus subtilis]|uniref:Uncharacterized protein n=1 Tax=Bacillus subtilis TaxID=1423 RepID=A0A0D1JJW6_BACIU|nr:hypothetical protein SC09_Contig19orf01413 [Bacillus subtilis]
MKKVTILKASILFLAIASFHLFSIPHAFDIGHHYKAVADQQEMHEMKAGQNADDEKKSITGAFTLTALWAMAVLLLTAEKYGILPQTSAEKKLYTGQILSIVLFRQTSCSTSPDYVTKI